MAASSSAGLSLLIVDDSVFIRGRIQRALAGRKLGRVLNAGNGREAMEVFRREKPDLVTLDITMPEVDGIACTREMVAVDPRAMILIVSALADKATAIKALTYGANGFLLKPFTDDQLNDALTVLLKGKSP